jgi:putative phosphoribosyl transferase
VLSLTEINRRPHNWAYAGILLGVWQSRPVSTGRVGKRAVTLTDPAAAPRCVRLEPIGLDGLLRLPAGARGFVLFAHGSGSGRLSPRNNHVASALAEAGLASLLFDLLTEAEAADRGNIFDIALLAERLGLATAWAAGEPALADLPLGYFGASTGAAAALVAAAQGPERLRAVVSRGGRPDLAGPLLGAVQAPTLLIVGGLDHGVIALNEAALLALHCERQLTIVPGATHLFEEPGKLDQVVALARHWFLEHMAGALPVEGNDVAP